MTHRSDPSLCNLGHGLSATELNPVRTSGFKPACPTAVLNQLDGRVLGKFLEKDSHNTALDLVYG